MSLGYAEKLSYKEDLGGSFGRPEINETDSEVLRKVRELAELINQAERVVVFTGAGISTSCGIPDFRGPKGVWTLQKKGLPFEAPASAFALACPSPTHLALVALRATGKLTYVVSQNVDNLHLRSGLEEAAVAELHGNCFIEKCATCGAKYHRDFEIETVGFKQTGRKCTVEGCRGRLKDMVLDWDDALPEDDLEASEKHADQAQLALCLGTSLQVRPANNLPLRTKKAGGKLAIVNLQKTYKDSKADLVIHAKCDRVMTALMQTLGIQLPVYTRTDAYILECTQTRCKQGFTGTVALLAADGLACPLPMLDHVTIRLQSGEEELSCSPHDEIVLDGLPWRESFMAPSEISCLACTFRFSPAADASLQAQERQLAVVFAAASPDANSKKQISRMRFEFTTQIQDYSSQTFCCESGLSNEPNKSEQRGLKRIKLASG